MKKQIILSVTLALAGVVYSFTLFSSYAFSGICAFGSGCPTLFGQPVCLFGLLGFLFTLVLLFGLWKYSRINVLENFARILFWLTFGGMLFALFFLIQELFVQDCSVGGCQFSWSYPSCLYGFLLFGGLFLMAQRILRRVDEKKEKDEKKSVEDKKEKKRN